jgi:hypothetical protein
MTYDTDFRECPCAAVDTLYPMTQKGANTPGAFVVPTTATRITSIKIMISGLSTDVVTGTTCAVNLRGSGLKGVGEGWFPGPLCSESGAAATSGGFDYREGELYKTNIPVNPGGQFEAYAVVNGEDMGTAHMLLWIEYDGEAGIITDCDYREGDIGAAANTLVALIARGDNAAANNFKPKSRIVEVRFGAALDPTGDAANGLVFAPAMALSGPGLMAAGNYDFLGPAGPTQPDTDVAGNQSVVTNLSRYFTKIDVKVGSDIIASAQNIESINPGHAIVALCYG